MQAAMILTKVNLIDARGRRSDVNQFNLRLRYKRTLTSLLPQSNMFAVEPLISRSAGVHRRNSWRNPVRIRSVLSCCSVKLVCLETSILIHRPFSWLGPLGASFASFWPEAGLGTSRVVNTILMVEASESGRSPYYLIVVRRSINPFPALIIMIVTAVCYTRKNPGMPRIFRLKS
jgi:hypothetical protein